MIAGRHNFIMEQGSEFNRTILWKNSAGAINDLTGYTARMTIREQVGDGSAIDSLTSAGGEIVLGGTAGTIQLLLTSTVTAAFDFDRAVYDLELLPGGTEAEAFKLLKGHIYFQKEVTT